MTNRFTIQPSEKEGFWIARDDKAGISIEFLENSFSPEELGALRERLEFECEAVENGPRAAIGRRIAELRRELGFSQRELARRAGISQPNLVNIEAGKYSAGLDILWRIARALGRAVYIV